MKMTEPLQIDLRNTRLAGPVLDIGGGGEGIVSRLHPGQVIALDRRLDELQEARGLHGPLAAEARQTPFVNASLAVCTSFFTLMYLPDVALGAVASELGRVIQKGGLFRLWEPVILKADPFIVHLRVFLPKETVTVSYGVYMAGKNQTPKQFTEVFERSGWELRRAKLHGSWFEQEWIRG